MEQEKKPTTAKKAGPTGGNMGTLLGGGIGAVVAIVAILFFIAPNPSHESGFETLDEVLGDANKKEELADPESYKDHRRPSWKSYYLKEQPGFVGKKLNNLLSFFGLAKRPNWSGSYFKHLLEKRIKEREEKGMSSEYEYVQRIVPTEKSRFIIWGDLTGAHHSLVRGVKKLTELGLLDKNLKLTSPDDYILFMGDAAARSPFIMELLTLIMKLEERNPGKIHYITGNNEKRGAWYTYGLKEAIEYKAGHLTSEEAPLFKTVEKYFETLPLAVYASIHPHQTNEFIRFSHFSMEVPSKESYRPFVELLDDSYYSDALIKDRKVGTNMPIKLSEKRGEPSLEPVNVRATVKSYRKTREYQKNEGLRFLVPDKNATAWTVLSSPSVFVHKVLKFYHDAFVVVQSAPTIDAWTIKHYYRDIREDKDFESQTYNFLTGKNISGGKEAVREGFKKAAEPKAKTQPTKPVPTGKIRR